MRYLTIRKFSSESGYSEAAVRSKIQGDVWLKGQVWCHAPDGRVLIDVEGYEVWVQRGKSSAGDLRKRDSARRPNQSIGMKADAGSPAPLE